MMQVASVVNPPSVDLVSLRCVAKVFANGAMALEGLDFEVREGETLSLLGPSGCGKSTALRLIAELSRPTSGEIVWRSSRRPALGVVFQEPTLLPWADVFSNVYLPLRLSGRSPAQARSAVSEAIELVGLSGFHKALPRELSGGMKMRAAIARAIVTRPELLLMDEPFAALDEVTRFKLNDDLLALKRELRTTIVFVTHSVYESVYLSTRILVMASRGGGIIDKIDVDPEGPRDADYRSSRRFSELCRRASRALQCAVGEIA